MQIKKLYGIEGAKNANGIVVVVDIFRAASLEACALANGAKYIIPVSTKEEAFNLKKSNPNYLIAGEQNGYKIERFDYGNSPFNILKENLTDKIIVHRSTEGTQGLVNATQADELIFGSFLTLSATRKHIQKINPQILSIVAMSGRGTEDDQYLQFLAAEIEQKNPNLNEVKEFIRLTHEAKKFFDHNEPQFPMEDFDICLDLDRYNFFVSVKKENGFLKAEKFE